MFISKKHIRLRFRVNDRKYLQYSRIVTQVLEDNYHKEARCTGGKATHSSTIKHGNFICENELKKKTVKKKRQYQSLPNSIT